MSARRFPDAVFGHGSEPDARFSLANERTFLAWIRTERALRESQPLPGPGFSGVLAAGVILAGLLIGIGLLL